MQKFIANNTLRTQHGFTLVELMVAIVLALLLAIVAIQSYLSTKTTYRATEQNARIQENLRFATHFINREVRQAGNIGCFQKINSHLSAPNANVADTVRRLYDPRLSVNVWRYSVANGSTADNFNLSSNDAYNVPEFRRGRWRDAAAIRRPTVALNSDAMEGSDIIAVTKISEPLGIRLGNTNSRNSFDLAVTELNGNIIPTGQVLLVGDCNSSDLFVHTGGDISGNNGTLRRGNTSNLRVRNATETGLYWQKSWDATAEVRFVESTLFFIGQGASGLPALFQLEFGPGLGVTGAAGTAQPVEIVDGIEFMRALVGLDSDNDNNVDQYLRIDEIGGANNTPDIRSLQIGLLAVGDQNTNIDGANARTFQLTQRHQVISPVNLPDGIGPTGQTVQDTRYRQATTTTIQIRNAGLRRSPEVVDFFTP